MPVPITNRLDIRVIRPADACLRGLFLSVVLRHVELQVQ